MASPLVCWATPRPDGFALTFNTLDGKLMRVFISKEQAEVLARDLTEGVVGVPTRAWAAELEEDSET